MTPNPTPNGSDSPTRRDPVLDRENKTHERCTTGISAAMEREGMDPDAGLIRLERPAEAPEARYPAHSPTDPRPVTQWPYAGERRPAWEAQAYRDHRTGAIRVDLGYRRGRAGGAPQTHWTSRLLIPANDAGTLEEAANHLARRWKSRPKVLGRALRVLADHRDQLFGPPVNRVPQKTAATGG